MTRSDKSLWSNEYIILLTFQRNFALGSIPDEIFPIQACNFLRSNNHPIKRCSIVVVYVISTRAKNVRKWIRFRYKTMVHRSRRRLFWSFLFLKINFFLKKKLPLEPTDVGPSNFLISSNHSLKHCEVVVVYIISNCVENDGPLKRLRHSTIASSKSDVVCQKWIN